MEAVEGISNATVDAVEKAAASVVRITRGRASASGTVVESDLVLTSATLVRGEEDVDVALADGSTRRGTVVGTDPASDLALVRVEGGGLTPLPWRDPRSVKVGEHVLALARPGRSIRASARIVGVVGRDVGAGRGVRLPFWIETDRGLPDGFLGGPLVDLQARLVGIDTDRLVRGADLAIDADTANRVISDLRDHGRMRRGWIGVAVSPARLPDALKTSAQSSAVVIVDLELGGPADRAGLFVGDLVLAVDDTTIAGPADLAAALRARPGRDIELHIARGGARETRKLTTTERD